MPDTSFIRVARDIWWSNAFIKLPCPEPIPGLEDQTIIVTGSNGGLGYEASQHLLRIGLGKLIIAVRSTEKGEAARVKLLEATNRDPSTVEVWHLDMCNFESVKTFAKRATDTLPRLDGVLANAAIATANFDLDEGHERSLTVNVLSPCLLFLLLLPKLREAPSVARFSLVNSKVHYMATLGQLQQPGGVDIPMFTRLDDPAQADMPGRYNLSKLLALYATRELARQTGRSGKAPVVLNAPNPSYCRSALEREENQVALKIRYAMMAARKPEMGSRALVHGVLAGQETHGQFLSDCKIEAPSPTVTSNDGQTLQKAFYKEMMRALEAVSPGISDNI